MAICDGCTHTEVCKFRSKVVAWEKQSAKELPKPLIREANCEKYQAPDYWVYPIYPSYPVYPTYPHYWTGYPSYPVYPTYPHYWTGDWTGDWWTTTGGSLFTLDGVPLTLTASSAYASSGTSCVSLEGVPITLTGAPS